jgi:hypothetical protein
MAIIIARAKLGWRFFWQLTRTYPKSSRPVYDFRNRSPDRSESSFLPPFQRAASSSFLYLALLISKTDPARPRACDCLVDHFSTVCSISQRKRVNTVKKFMFLASLVVVAILVGVSISQAKYLRAIDSNAENAPASACVCPVGGCCSDGKCCCENPPCTCESCVCLCCAESEKLGAPCSQSACCSEKLAK